MHISVTGNYLKSTKILKCDLNHNLTQTVNICKTSVYNSVPKHGMCNNKFQSYSEPRVILISLPSMKVV